MDITEVLPVDGAAGRMLIAALKRDPDYAWDAVVDLSREAGLARITGARAHARLVAAGILIEGDGGWWVVNQDHPYLPLLRRIVEEVAGPPQAPLFQPAWLVENPELEAALATSLVGPSMLTLRTTREELGEITDALYSIEPALQDVYALTKDERARDLIHQLMGRRIGWGVNDSTEILMAGLRATDPSPDPATTPTPIGIWLLALHDVAREVAVLETMIDWLVDGVAEGARLQSLRDKVLGELAHHLANSSTIDTAEQQGQIARTRVEDITRWLGEHRGRFDQSRGDLHYVGGTPHYEDLGGLGDQLCAVLLYRQSKRLHAVAERMMKDPAYLEWVQGHPDDAVAVEASRGDLRARYRSRRR